MKVVILAGGSGTRLWPVSCQDYPKQFLDFGDNESLLQKTIKRFKGATFLEEIIVVINTQHAHLVEKQLAAVDPKVKSHILVEPYQRNTGPAVALAVKYLQAQFAAKGNSKVLVIPSDQLIAPEELFIAYMEKAEKIDTDKIITFGIRPKTAQTGYGYIRKGRKEGFFIYQVEKFVEKPELKLAQGYVLDKDYYWNLGIFLFSIDTFFRELKIHNLEIFKNCQTSYLDFFNNFHNMPNISFDYAILEKSRNIALFPMEGISWSDVGCWDSIYNVLKKDDNDNVKRGNVIDIDTKHSLILGTDRLISTIGLENVLIVDTKDAIFIGQKGKSQKIKRLVEKLQEQKEKTSNEPWGESKILVQEGSFRLQHIVIFPFQAMNKKTDRDCFIHYLVIRGEGRILVAEKVRVFLERDSFDIPAGWQYKIENLSQDQLELMEIVMASNQQVKVEL